MIRFRICNSQILFDFLPIFSTKRDLVMRIQLSKRCSQGVEITVAADFIQKFRWLHTGVNHALILPVDVASAEQVRKGLDLRTVHVNMAMSIDTRRFHGQIVKISKQL